MKILDILSSDPISEAVTQRISLDDYDDDAPRMPGKLAALLRKPWRDQPDNDSEKRRAGSRPFVNPKDPDDDGIREEPRGVDTPLGYLWVTGHFRDRVRQRIADRFNMTEDEVIERLLRVIARNSGMLDLIGTHTQLLVRDPNGMGALIKNQGTKEEPQWNFITIHQNYNRAHDKHSDTPTVMIREGDEEIFVLDEKWTKKYKKSINCSHPKGFSQKAHCAARRKRARGGKTKSRPVHESLHQAAQALEDYANQHISQEREAFGDFMYHAELLRQGHPDVHREDLAKLPADVAAEISDIVDQHDHKHSVMEAKRKRAKTLIDGMIKTLISKGRTHDEAVADLKKQIDARFYEAIDGFIADDILEENLRDWFKQKWVRFGPDGKIRGACARGNSGEGKPKCLPQKKAHALGKKGRASAARRKRREDPNPERHGKAKNVRTKEGVAEDMTCPHCGGIMVSEDQLSEKKDACYYKVKSRYKVWPSAYASGALVQCRKKGAKNWGKGKAEESLVLEREAKDKIADAVIRFYRDNTKLNPPEDYAAAARELIKAAEPNLRDKIKHIIQQGKSNPYLQGGVITTIGALLAGKVIGLAAQYGLSPYQTNLILQGVLNTVIPTLVSKINGRDWKETIKYTLASAGTGIGIAAMGGLEEDEEGAVHDLMGDLGKQRKKLAPLSVDDRYERINDIMQRVSKANGVTAKQLHKAWIERYGELPDEWVLDENFADGKGPGRPGDSQRHGIPKNATMAQLQKAAKAPGRKGQLARWQINMRRGRKKS